jgi:hypothetical protein
MKDNSLFIIVAGNNLFYKCTKAKESNINTNAKFICQYETDYYDNAINSSVNLFARKIIVDEDHIGMNAFCDDYKVNVIKAEMKMGKTKALIEYLHASNFKTIIVISFRRTFSAEILSKLDGFTLYSDIANDIYISDYPKLIVQIESLHRIKMPMNYSLVILDEVESIWSQFSSSNFTNFGICINKFEAILKLSQKIICMDANICKRTFDILRKIVSVDDIHYYVNTWNPSRDYCYNICTDKGSWVYQLQELLKKDANIAIFSNSLAEANKIFLFISNHENYKGKVMQYDSKTKESIKKLHFSNVDKYWEKYRCIICTPTVSAGISFEVEKHFDYIFGYFTDKSCNVETCRQMLGRVRSIASQNIYLYLVSSGEKFDTNISRIQDLIKRDKADLFADNIGLLGFKIDTEKNKLEPFDNFAFEIITQNIAFHNISKSNFYGRFYKQIRGDHLKIRSQVKQFNVPKEQTMQILKCYNDGGKIIDDNHIECILSAENISHYDFSQLNEKRRKLEDLKSEDLYAIEKYKIANILATELDKPLLEIFTSQIKLKQVKALREIFAISTSNENSIDTNIANMYLQMKKNEHKSKFLDYRNVHRHKICRDLCKMFDPIIDISLIPCNIICIENCKVADEAEFIKLVNDNAYIFDLPLFENASSSISCIVKILAQLYGIRTKYKTNELLAPDFIYFIRNGNKYRGSRKSHEGKIINLPTINIELFHIGNFC